MCHCVPPNLEFYFADIEGYVDLRRLPGKVGLWMLLEMIGKSALAQPIGVSQVVSVSVLFGF